MVGDRFRKVTDEPAANPEWLPGIHVRLSAMWGVGLLVVGLLVAATIVVTKRSGNKPPLP